MNRRISYIYSMNDDIRDDLIKGVKKVQYAYLRLSDKQAQQIYAMEEEDRAVHPYIGMGLSYWEEKEYEWDRMREILTAKQLVRYEEKERLNREAYEAQLRKTDAGMEKEVVYGEECNRWLSEDFVPAYRIGAMRAFILLTHEQEKIAYLRAAYAKFLATSRRRALVHHYHYSHRFEPNKLRLVMLHQDALGVMPGYERFISESDAPTQAIAAFVLEQYQPYIRHSADFLRQQANETKEKYKALREKHFGDPELRGWHTTIYPKNALSVEESMMMSLALMG